MRLAPLLALLLAPTAALAAPGKPGACGLKILPLAVGNVWTYNAVASTTPATPDIVRIAPPIPMAFVITVKAIDTKGPDTVVSLEEKVTYDLTKDPKKPVHDDRVFTTSITCNAQKVDISPDSFFFAGEPGGFDGLSIDKLDRVKGTSWQLTKGTIGDAEWREDLLITWTRHEAKGSDAKLGSGKLELERRYTPQQPEQIVTKGGSYKAEKLALQTTGRVTLDSPRSTGLKPMELPADWINQMWMVEGLGVVQTHNRYEHVYQLVDSQLQ